jgi:hypothetical protein
VPPWGLERHHRFELQVIPRTPKMDAAEEELANALVVMVGGPRSIVSPSSVLPHLVQFYQVPEVDVQVKRYSRVDFLLVFSGRQLVDHVLHTAPPRGTDLLLVFQRWRQQAGALFQPFYFKVLLSISNVPVHVWSLDTIQAVSGSSCLVFEAAPQSMDGSDLSSFMVVAWARHPDLIPTEVGCSIPEPVEPFIERESLLFLRASEVIHSMCNLLHFRAYIRVLETHDFTPPADFDDEGNHGGSSSSSEEDYPVYDPRCGILQPWPRVHKLAPGRSPSGEPWLSLSSAGGRVSWLWCPRPRSDQRALSLSDSSQSHMGGPVACHPIGSQSALREQGDTAPSRPAFSPYSRSPTQWNFDSGLR